MNTPEIVYLLVRTEGEYDGYHEEVLGASFRREPYDERATQHNDAQAKKRKYTRTYLEVREVPFTP